MKAKEIKILQQVMNQCDPIDVLKSQIDGANSRIASLQMYMLELAKAIKSGDERELQSWLDRFTSPSKG